jgi:hypothetical protein
METSPAAESLKDCHNVWFIIPLEIMEVPSTKLQHIMPYYLFITKYFSHRNHLQATDAFIVACYEDVQWQMLAKACRKLQLSSE